MHKRFEHRLGDGSQSCRPIEDRLDFLHKGGDLRATCGSLDFADPDFATHVVDCILYAAQRSSASDVHLLPFADGLRVLFRIDGVLQPQATFPTSVAANIVARLKVLAELLTYRDDVPQEGRIRVENPGHVEESHDADLGAANQSVQPLQQQTGNVEMRVSTFPTLYGERAVVRLFAGLNKYRRIDDLGLPTDIAVRLKQLLQRPSGAIIATGPAGSGKTTTIYACLRELVGNGRNPADVDVNDAAESGTGENGDAGADASCIEQPPRRNIVSLEDPIEVAVNGVSQSQVGSRAGFDLATGLRFIMRQDPEVIMVGEIRDPATAEAALQASLTGHLVLTTFHAGSAVEAVGRLLDMGIEPYLLRSGLLAIVSQHLARRLCTCSRTSDNPREMLDFSVEQVSLPVGCEACHHSGFRDRFVLAEMLIADRTDLGRAILSRSDTTTIERLAVEGGMITQHKRGVEAVATGVTSPREIHRVLGDAAFYHTQDEG